LQILASAPVSLAPLTAFWYVLTESSWGNLGVEFQVAVSIVMVATSIFAALWIIEAGVKQQDVEQKDALNYYVFAWTIIQNGPTGNSEGSGPHPLDSNEGTDSS
jgi:hypothetical protein